MQNLTFPARELPGDGEPELSVFAVIFLTFPADLSQQCRMSDFMSDVGFNKSEVGFNKSDVGFLQVGCRMSDY